MRRPYRVIQSAEQRIGRFTVVMDTLDIDGEEYPYSYIREKDFVCVLPICGNAVVYLRQYRHAVDTWKLEFPCGVIENGEMPEQAAVRELLEETGCRALSLTGLGCLHAKAGTSTAKVYLFFADCALAREQNTDPAEFIEVYQCPFDDFQEKIKTGEFDQVYGLIAWYRSESLLIKKEQTEPC